MKRRRKDVGEPQPVLPATSSPSGQADPETSDPVAAEAQDASLSSTLMRGIEILQCFDSGGGALGNAEISRRLDLSRPTVSRLCKTLVHLGYLRRDITRTRCPSKKSSYLRCGGLAHQKSTCSLCRAILRTRIISLGG